MTLNSPRIPFLDFPVDQVTLKDVLHWIADKSRSGRSHTIVVINTNKLWLANKQPRLANIIRCADLVIPEYSVTWGAARLGLPHLHPVYGVELTKQFIPYAAQNGLRPFFLGASQQTIDSLMSKLQLDYPNLKLAGAHHGYLNTPAMQEEAVRAIQKSGADILFVAMGSPRQEYWIEEHRECLNVPVLVGVGGTLDVLAGMKADTPAWIRGTGTEWLFRTIQNPRGYLYRYLVTNPWFIYQIWKALLSQRLYTH